MSLNTCAADAGPREVPSHLGRWLAFLLAVTFFSNAPVYLNLFLVPSIRPLHWMFAFGIGLLALWLRPSFWRHGFSAGLPLWVLSYALLCIVWFVSFGGGDPEIVRQRIVALLFLLVAYLVIGASAESVAAARKAIGAVVVLSVAVNAFDISHPFVLIPAESEFATLGRASGLYGNPNQSGAALVLGFVITISLVPSRWRAAYLAYVGVGVVLTLSRGAMLGLVLVVVGLWLKRLLTTRQIVTALLIGGLGIWVAARVLLPVLIQQFNLDPAFIIDRLFWIMDPESRADFSQLERAYLAEKGWQQFLHAPLLGNGIGSSEVWEARASTHNIYVMLLSDFGIVGALVVPTLLLAVIHCSGANATPERWVLGAFVLLWGVTSHNILTEYYALISLATIAAMQGPGAGVERRELVDVSGKIPVCRQ